MGESASLGAVQLFILGFSINGINIIFFATITRLLPISDIGIYSGLALLTQTLLAVFTLGMNTAATKFISQRVNEDGKPHKSILLVFYKVILASGILAGSICMIFSTFISDVLFQTIEYSSLIQLLSLDILFILLISVATGVLLGELQYKPLTIISVSYYLIRSLIGVLLILIGWGVAGVLVGWIIGDCLGAILLILLSLHMATSTESSLPFSKVITYAAPIYLSNLILIGSTIFDKYAVLYFLGFESLAIYHSVVTAYSIVQYLTSAITSALFPIMCKVENRGSRELMKQSGKIVSRYVFIIYISLAMALAAFSGPALLIIAGTEYIGGSTALMIISMVTAVFSGVMVFDIMVKSSDDVTSYFFAYIIAILIELLACIIFIPMFGINGAAISRSLLTCILFFLLGFILYRRGILLLDRGTFAKIFIIALIGWVSVNLVLSTSGISIFSISISAVVFTLIMIVGIRLSKIIDAYDYQILSLILPRRLVKLFKWVFGCKTNSSVSIEALQSDRD